MWRSSLWSISWLHHQMFYPYVTISAAQACESDNLRHAMSQFSLFLSSFSGAQRILGYVRPRRIVAVHPPKTEKRRSIRIGTPFALHSDVIGLQMLLWKNGQSSYWLGCIISYFPHPQDRLSSVTAASGGQESNSNNLLLHSIAQSHRHSIAQTLTDHSDAQWIWSFLIIVYKRSESAKEVQIKTVNFLLGM